MVSFYWQVGNLSEEYPERVRGKTYLQLGNEPDTLLRKQFGHCYPLTIEHTIIITSACLNHPPIRNIEHPSLSLISDSLSLITKFD